MTELHIRNLPPEVHELLRERASAEGRSMSAQAVTLLRMALQPAVDRAAQRRTAAKHLQEIRFRNRLPADAPPSETLMRDDRDMAG